jgi:hypothetical protein
MEIAAIRLLSIMFSRSLLVLRAALYVRLIDHREAMLASQD